MAKGDRVYTVMKIASIEKHAASSSAVKAERTCLRNAADVIYLRTQRTQIQCM